MPRISDSTLPSRRLPSVVLVAPDAELVILLEKAVQDMDEVPRVQTAALSTAATVVAEWRPFAIVVPIDVLQFDPLEFQALARDVGADVVDYDPGLGSRNSATMLMPRLEESFSRWAASEFAGP